MHAHQENEKSMRPINAMQIVLVTAFIWTASFPGSLFAADMTATHHLNIHIEPARQMLSGIDRIEVTNRGKQVLGFRLSPLATGIVILVNDQLQAAQIDNGVINVPLTAADETGTVQIEIRYSVKFDDPVPLQPVSTDNPGYGVSASISERGAFLLSGAGWYPELIDAAASYDLKVVAPPGWLAVTSGRLKGHRTDARASFSEWSVNEPVEGLALSVGPFKVTTKEAGKLKAATYFLTDAPELARSYLEAALKYMELYSSLFGAYAFDRFVIVENFFQTGYGFPGYTLLGSRVLRLPFIIDTSLGHEIAHCWWGNGVTVDFRQGNWSEGLTTYVADYLYQERSSPDAALEYRRQILRSYTSLVAPEADFPLEEFTARKDPLTKSIGYDKGAMVFHMLRRQIGEEAFWGALRDVYRQRLFVDTSWDDLQAAFERRAGRDLGTFFRQWVTQGGVPQFRLLEVGFSRSGPSGPWIVSGLIHQDGPIFQFPVRLELQTGGGNQDQIVQVSGRRTAFRVTAGFRPDRLVLDPQIDLMRRLYQSEIPPTVNSLKGAGQVALLLSDRKPQTKALAETLVASMGLVPSDVVYADKKGRTPLPNSNILVVGRPPSTAELGDVTAAFVTASGALKLDNVIYDRPGDVFFCVFRHPNAARGTVGLFWSPGNGGTAEARKITHYGKYSYLVFREGRNIAKGSWPMENSPLERRWQ